MAELAMAGRKKLDMADGAHAASAAMSVATLPCPAVLRFWWIPDKSKGFTLRLLSPLYDTKSRELSGGGKNCGRLRRETCAEQLVMVSVTTVS